MFVNNFKRLKGKIAAVLAIVFCLSLVSIPKVSINAQETKQETQMRAEILSPRVNEDGTVTFRVKYDSEELYIAGTMNSWNPTATPMTKGADGVFEVTLELGVGTHQYKYVAGDT